MDKKEPLAKLISIKGKKALITGSASGLGKAMAYRLAEAGANLELVDINEKNLEKVKKDLSKFRRRINLHIIDLTEKEEIDNLWSKLKGKEPDILINNAGMYPFKEFTETDEKFLKKVMDLNFTSVYWMCQHMIEQRKKKGGTIINIGSIEVFLPFQKDLAHYTASKASVAALSRGLARDYGSKGFKINVIIPGAIMTEGTKGAIKFGIKEVTTKIDPSFIKSGVSFNWRLPKGRWGRPDEIAKVALFLSSDLSSYMCGALVVVDGGFLSN